jgi:CBS domain-containing protein
MTDRPRIRDYMAQRLVLLSPDTEINRAAAVLLDRGISGAPVVDARGGLVGVLSKKDCLRAALHASYYRDWGGTVERYMTRDPQTLDADMDIVEAAEAFLSSSFRRFPVLSEGALVGQVSRADVLRGLYAHWA